MGFRFYRRLHLLPGLSVNLSRSGPSLSVGVRGAHVTVGRRGVTRTIGLPGSGVFYTTRSGLHTGVHSAAAVAPQTPAPPLASDRHVGRVIVVATVVLFAAFLAWWLTP